jgi:hypothetical protein
MKWHASALTTLDMIQSARWWIIQPHSHRGETWASHVTPELKQQSMEWRHTSSSIKKKFKQTISLLVRLYAQCFGTEKVFGLWNFCLKAEKPMQTSIATHLRNCIVRPGISDVACLVRASWCFMTMPTYTLPPQCKISSWYLAGNNSISPLQPRLSAKWFSCVPASWNFPWWPAVPWGQWGQRSH